MKKVELLAPAGDLECLKVAINNGADAVYLGGENFSARAYANNFSLEEIIIGINYAHIRNAKVYVGINTLIYDNEIKELLEFTDFLYINQVDALIVADFGLINLLKDRYKNLAIHVSTQLNTHTLWQVKLLESLNVERIVLSRETPLEVIKNITSNTNIDIEVFIHGALCVCYSGNCLHSSLIGKRSGNRGKCAQPCRMEYTLLENGKEVSNKKYLLSTKDLCTVENIDKILDSNVKSLKIEGRMKSKEYVGYVVSTYRQAIDNYYENKYNKINKETLLNLKKIYSREFTKGFILNENNGDFTNDYRQSHIGVLIGKVIKIKDDRVQIKLYDNLSQKDKITIVQNKANDIKLYVSKIFKNNKLVSCGYRNEIVEIIVTSKVINNSFVYKTVDNSLMCTINDDFLGKIKRIPIKIKFLGQIGKVMTLIIKDYDNHQIKISSNYIIEKALNCPTTSQMILKQLSKLQDSAYFINESQIVNDEKGIIPLKEINELRRQAIKKLDELRINKYQRNLSNINLENQLYLKESKKTKKLKIKVKNLQQLDALVSLKEIDSFYYEDALTYQKAKEKYPNLKIIFVLPRVYENENSTNYNYKSYVINNYGDQLKYENNPKIIDLYMNITNTYSIAYLNKYNIESYTLSLELNFNQIEEIVNDLIEAYQILPPLEMVVYGHYQTMITKYCFISKEHGFSNKHCGACKEKQYALLDRMNYIFPVTTDENCNVTIYNSKAVCLIDYCQKLYDLGISSLRLDFSIESPKETYRIAKAFIDMINNGSYSYEFKDVTYGYFLDTQSN